jgi:hypothetical protein
MRATGSSQSSTGQLSLSVGRMCEQCAMLTSVVRLHSLQGMAQHAAALHVDLSLLGDDRALDAASRPEVVVHRPPWRLRVCAVVRCAVLSTHKARRSPGELAVDHAFLVHSRLDGVRVAVLRELDGHTVGIEGVLPLIESVVLDGVARPKRRLFVVGEEELAVELNGHS